MYRALRKSASVLLLSVSLCTFSSCTIGPRTAEDWHKQGLIQTQHGRLDKALVSFDKAVGLEPNNSTMLINRGLVRDEQGDHEGAIADYSEALSLEENEDNLVATYYNRANAHHNLGQFEQAVADCSRAIEIEPEFAYAYANRAVNLESLGKKDEAIADLKAALSLFKANSDTDNVNRITAKLSEI